MPLIPAVILQVSMLPLWRTPRLARGWLPSSVLVFIYESIHFRANLVLTVREETQHWDRTCFPCTLVMGNAFPLCFSVSPLRCLTCRGVPDTVTAARIAVSLLKQAKAQHVAVAGACRKVCWLLVLA